MHVHTYITCMHTHTHTSTSTYQWCESILVHLEMSEVCVDGVLGELADLVHVEKLNAVGRSLQKSATDTFTLRHCYCLRDKVVDPKLTHSDELHRNATIANML